MAATLIKTNLIVRCAFTLQRVYVAKVSKAPMVPTPTRRHSSQHRRSASIRAQRAIQAISPVRASERRAERRRVTRDRARRARAALLRGMREVLGLPQQHRRRRQPPRPRAPVNELVIISSDSSSAEDLPRQQVPPLVDLNSSEESLPNIDPRPQWQLPVEPLADLGPLNITQELLPPLQHQTLREAYVLLQQLQLPPLQHITPPPESPPRAPTPPPEEVERWDILEVELARLDDSSYAVTVTQPLVLQQPCVGPVPEHVPATHTQPQQMPAVDWALVAHALFTVAEAENRTRANNPINHTN